MEWVEITGATVEEARERALDHLGVDASDAEIEVLEESGRSMLGLRRVEARVRARVRPTAPLPRQDRNGRRRSQSRSKSKTSRGDQRGKAGSGGQGSSRGQQSSSRDGKPKGGQNAKPDGSDRKRGESAIAEKSSGSGRKVRKAGPSKSNRPKSADQQQEKTVSEEISVEDQGAMIVEFLDGLVESFELSGSAAVVSADAEAIEVGVSGSDLGLLIGPGGHTLAALGEVTKTVLQRRTSGASRARVRIDVAGYRERRRVALSAFAETVAAAVISSGESRALEPMHSADRKVVHDTVNDIEGVGTISDGDEPRRRVVVVPAS